MTELGPDYGGPDYDAEVRSLGRTGVRCGCGCGQDAYDSFRRLTGPQGLVRTTEFTAVFPDWDEAAP